VLLGTPWQLARSSLRPWPGLRTRCTPRMRSRGKTRRQASLSHAGHLAGGSGLHELERTLSPEMQRRGCTSHCRPSSIVSCNQSSVKRFASLEIKQVLQETKTFSKKAAFSWQRPGCRGRFGVPPASLPQLGLPRSLVAGPQGRS